MKSEKLAKNPLLPITVESLQRLDEILQVMTEPNTEFPSAENSEWVQDYFEYIHRLEEMGLFLTHIMKVEAPKLEDKETQCWVHNQTKSMVAQLPYDETMMTWLEGRPKIFIEGRIWADGTIQFVRIVDNKEW